MHSVRVQSVSKQYRIGAEKARYDTLRDQISEGAKRLVTRRSIEERRRMIWALRDASFDIDEGEVVGLIGRNGAGKTTMLRLLSRITEPTSGRIELLGRVGSLLEVGTGFHPELTGRENVFLNGGILGMPKKEIARKFDEIVDFSGVETFIDTPVKRYSSGMQVRLAFAVAAHLEPEILLVDEVLAVGDAEFQKRCLGKMESVGRAGRTVIFVSHSMPTILRLCERAILLDGGRVVDDGPAESVASTYLSSDHGTSSVREWDPAEAPGTEFVRLAAVRVLGEELQLADAIDIRERTAVEMVFDVLGPGPVFVPIITLHNDQGVHIFNALDPDPRWRDPLEPGRYITRAWIPANMLNEGRHILSVALNTLVSGKAIRNADAREAVAFQVVDRGEGPSAKGNFAQQWGGAISPLLDWTLERA